MSVLFPRLEDRVYGARYCRLQLAAAHLSSFLNPLIIYVVPAITRTPIAAIIIIIAAKPQLVNISNLSGSNNRTLLNEDTNDPTTVNIEIPLHTPTMMQCPIRITCNENMKHLIENLRIIASNKIKEDVVYILL